MIFSKSTLTITLTSILALSVISCGSKEATNDAEQKVEVNKKNVKQQAEEMSHEVDHAEAKAKPVVVVATTEKGIVIENAYATATIPGQKSSAAYFVMKNTSNEDIEATAISSNVSDSTEFHSMEMKDSKMYMRTIKELVIPAGGEIVFSEGANHIMLLNLKEPLEAGSDMQLNIKFSNTESVEFTLPITEKSTGGMAHNHEGHEHKEHSHEHSHEAHENEGHEHEHKHEDESHEHEHKHEDEGHEHEHKHEDESHEHEHKHEDESHEHKHNS